MAGHSSAGAGWYIWLSELSIIPPEYHEIISMISTFFVILALTPIVPIVVLFIYDVSLWLWRLSAASWRARATPPIEIAGENSTVTISGTAANGEGATT